MTIPNTTKLIIPIAIQTHPALNRCWNIRNTPRLNEPNVNNINIAAVINSDNETSLILTRDNKDTPLQQNKHFTSHYKTNMSVYPASQYTLHDNYRTEVCIFTN